MKIMNSMPLGEWTRKSRRSGGFTLPELIVASTVLILIVGGMVSANLFGMRMFQVAQTKMTTTDFSRNTIGKLSDEVRTCNASLVGNVTNGTFVSLPDGLPQQGNGLIIYPTTNTSSYVLYFINKADQSLRRTTSTQGSTKIIAQPITNLVGFSAQDFAGNVLTNNQNNRVFHVDLEFYRPKQFFNDADYYKLETSMTRRAR